MDKLPFLSERWLAAVNQMCAAVGPATRAGPVGGTGPADLAGEAVRVNQVITGAPFGDGTVLAHVDASSWPRPLGLGHLEGADVTLVLDYAVAKAMLVEANPQAAMKAFMTGQLRVHGEMAKLITAQQQMPHIFGPELAARIRQITS
jgi:hypothetical protein